MQYNAILGQTTIELEPVIAVYRFHRKRMMWAKSVALEIEYINGCGQNSTRANANAMTYELKGHHVLKKSDLIKCWK